MENYVAMAMEVEVDKRSGAIRVRRVGCAHDCGLVINPDAVRLQIEGSILQTLSRTLYEEVLRVPLVMRYPPALRAASRTNELVSLADVAPTILVLCGLQTPSGMWGRSVLAAATGKLAPRDGPVLRCPPPSQSMPRIRYRSVSRDLPGPTISSHQPNSDDRTTQTLLPEEMPPSTRTTGALGAPVRR